MSSLISRMMHLHVLHMLMHNITEGCGMAVQFLININLLPLTERWAGRQFLCSAMCRTFQSEVDFWHGIVLFLSPGGDIGDVIISHSCDIYILLFLDTTHLPWSRFWHVFKTLIEREAKSAEAAEWTALEMAHFMFSNEKTKSKLTSGAANWTIVLYCWLFESFFSPLQLGCCIPHWPQH